jgi:hypothetical protein
LLAIVPDREGRAVLELHANADPERTTGLVLKLQLLEVFPHRLRDLADGDRLGVLDLFLGPKRVRRSAVPAVRTITRQVMSPKTGTGFDLEVTLARRFRAFAAQEAFRVLGDGEVHAIPEASEVIESKRHLSAPTTAVAASNEDVG